MQILWNGKPTDKFIPTRGIRRGDPSSPYLFVAYMERLSQYIEYIEEMAGAKQWSPISICRGGPEFSHLFFADDIPLRGKLELSKGV